MKARYFILLLVGAAIGAVAVGLTRVQTREPVHQDQKTQGQKTVAAPDADLVSAMADFKEPVYRVHKIVGTVFWKKSRAESTYRRLDPKTTADSLRLFYGGERLTCDAHSTLTLMALGGTRADTIIRGPKKDWPVPHRAAVNNDPAAARDAMNVGGSGFPLKVADKEGHGNPTDGPGQAIGPITPPASEPLPVTSAGPFRPAVPLAILFGTIAAIGALLGYVWLRRQKGQTQAFKRNGKY